MAPTSIGSLLHLTLQVLLLMCFLQCHLCLSIKSDKEEPLPPSVTISKADYCEGCKETVELYARVSSAEIQKMEKKGIASHSNLDGIGLIENICEHESLKIWIPAVKYACMKILDNPPLREQFLDHFGGSTSASSALGKADLFFKKQMICVDQARACRGAAFQRANVTKKERTTCRACHIIAGEVVRTRRLLVKKTRNDLIALFEGSFCNNLGYSHQPYAWLESTCDQMIEDQMEEILSILAFHDKVMRTGLTPSESAEDMMCREFYECSPNTNSGTSTSTNTNIDTDSDTDNDSDRDSNTNTDTNTNTDVSTNTDINTNTDTDTNTDTNTNTDTDTNPSSSPDDDIEEDEL